MQKNEQTERRVFALKFRTHATNQVLQQIIPQLPPWATTEQVQCVHRGLFAQDAPSGALDAAGNPTASVFDLPTIILWTLQKRNQLYGDDGGDPVSPPPHWLPESRRTHRCSMVLRSFCTVNGSGGPRVSRARAVNVAT